MKKNDEKAIEPSKKRDISIFDPSFAKRGLELASKLAAKDIIQGGIKITATNVSKLKKLAVFDVGEFSKKGVLGNGTIVNLSGYPYSIDISPDNRYLVVGLKNRKIRVWEIINGSHLMTLKCHTDRVSQVKFSPAGTLIASGSNDGEVRLWKFPDGELHKVLKPLEYIKDSVGKYWIRSIAFSPAGDILATIGERESAICLWRTKDGSLFKVLNVNYHAYSNLAFSVDGRELAYSSVDGDVEFWSVNESALLRTISGPFSSNFAYSPDGSKMVSWSITNSKIYFQYISSGSLIFDIYMKGNRPYDISIASDGSMLAVAFLDSNSIKFFSTTDGFLIAELEDHPADGRIIKFSPDGTLMASGSQDGTIIIWGIPSP